MLFGIVAVVLLLDGIWDQMGVIAAIGVVIGSLLVAAWRVDRRQRAKLAGIDELPLV